MPLLAFAVLILVMGALAEAGRSRTLQKKGSSLEEYYRTGKWP